MAYVLLPCHIAHCKQSDVVQVVSLLPFSGSSSVLDMATNTPKNNCEAVGKKRCTEKGNPKDLHQFWVQYHA